MSFEIGRWYSPNRPVSTLPSGKKIKGRTHGRLGFQSASCPILWTSPTSKMKGLERTND